MIIAHEKNAPGIEVPHPYRRTLKVLVSPSLHPELKTIAAGLSILPPGGKTDDHVHDEGELFYVLSGRGTIRVGDEVEIITPGTAVWGPPGKPHQLINEGRGALRVLWVLSPPGRERVILEQSG